MFIERPLKRKRNKPRKLIHGVALNDADYAVTYKDENNKTHSCPYYTTWVSMLDRVYSSKLQAKRPSYKGSSLDPDWLLFSNFKKWMQNQDWVGKHLDKDLLDWENKHYGPATCLFITPGLNNLLTLRRNHRGHLPLGVSETTINGSHYYAASCSFYGKQKRLGYFKSPADAANRYKDEKLKYIQKLAESEPNPKIKQALLALH